MTFPQAVFMILDHLNKWVRLVRQDISTKKAESKRARANQISTNSEEQVLRVDSILSSIDQNLMARAALQCKAYARSLMNFEAQIVSLREQTPMNEDLPSHYERLHEIYSYIDEPDGMEGVSTLILSPSLEHQIRQHESTGRWTSAQSCWEVRLQQSPDNLEFHLGLLRCLRNLGHYGEDHASYNLHLLIYDHRYPAYPCKGCSHPQSGVGICFNWFPSRKCMDGWRLD